jgi:hypothetical protein
MIQDLSQSHTDNDKGYALLHDRDYRQILQDHSEK